MTVPRTPRLHAPPFHLDSGLAAVRSPNLRTIYFCASKIAPVYESISFISRKKRLLVEGSKWLRFRCCQAIWLLHHPSSQCRIAFDPQLFAVPCRLLLFQQPKKSSLFPFKSLHDCCSHCCSPIILAPPSLLLHHVAQHDLEAP